MTARTISQIKTERTIIDIHSVIDAILTLASLTPCEVSNHQTAKVKFCQFQGIWWKEMPVKLDIFIVETNVYCWNKV